ncbi:MAG TPA: hypothetical protein VOA87_12290 [Thermoanaerobaculia bacterium]|nr:hypothetical protein [Thermoanaerobaculia bacterium]
MSDERKYRHRGYQDSGPREEPGRGGPQAPREKREGPRGRGLGAPTETVFRCAACGEKQTLSGEVTVEAVCGRCGAALHSCANCAHFDTSRRFECRQEIPERIAKKRAANSCGLFTPKAVQEFGKDRDKPADPHDPRAAFDALFKI